MAITNISITSVYVSDQDKAVDFYVNKLGFEKARDDKFDYGDGSDLRWIEVVPPGAETRIVLVKGFADWSEDKLGKNTGLAFNTTDTYATCEELKARGVEFTEDPNPQPWGIQAQIKDQDGNGIVLVGT
jgi:catechol 2,3-dioxygenase-like lactoylglutathione lyase family enzyme